MSKSNMTRFLLPFAVAIALVACKPQGAADPAADKAALQTAAEEWEKAYNDKNADAVAALYEADAQLLPPGKAAVNGGSALLDYWKNDIATNSGKLSVKADSTDVGGDWAWRSGTWSTDTSPALTGKYIEVWHRTANGWKIHRDIWNDDAAPAPPPDVAAPAAPAAPSAQ